MMNTFLWSKNFLLSFIFLCKTSLAQDQGAVRLQDGPNSYEGRVEAFYNGKWLRVCYRKWDMNDANVVCRQLGFSGATSYYQGFTPRGSGAFALNNVNCRGKESSISDCSHDGWGKYNTYYCGVNSNSDAGVVCVAEDDGKIRLVDGATNSTGRVEIMFAKQWGRVCDKGWANVDGNVACKQLGFSGAWAAYTGWSQRGSGFFWLSDVNCHGKESKLAGCSHPRPADISSSYCQTSRNDDAGVLCKVDGDGALRIVPIGSKHQGRVEVFFSGNWRRVCDYQWDLNDAHVVCRQLGYKGAWRYGAGWTPRGSGSYYLHGVNCNGKESKLLDCYHNTIWTSHSNCRVSSNDDAAVTCKIDGDAAIRLVDGNGNYSGRVEIRYGGIWRRVCDRDWDINDAQVVCRQLGFGAAKSAHKGWSPRGSGSYWLTRLNCIGNEATLNSCNRPNTIGSSSTSYCHSDGGDDAGVVCDPSTVSPTRPSPVTQPPVVPSTKLQCKDTDAILCNAVKIGGHCNSSYGKKHCCESCPGCRDVSTGCVQVKQHGLCESSSMKKVCCKTCSQGSLIG